MPRNFYKILTYKVAILPFLAVGIWALIFSSCRTSSKLAAPAKKGEPIAAATFFDQAAGLTVFQRDSLALKYLLNGAFPDFLRELVRVPFKYLDTLGKTHQVEIWVMPDYLSIGNNQDWIRLPLMPETAQEIADSFGCFLPSPYLVDRVYEAADIKLEPMPLFALRDSLPIFRQHHLMIEGQRKQRRGVVAGIKKDVVRSIRYFQSSRANRVVIYGWHQFSGKAIQPVYAGHVNWYVDYSHGIRLISRQIRVDGRWRRMEDLSKDPLLYGIVCDGQPCMLRYESPTGLSDIF